MERIAARRAGGRSRWPFPGFLFLLYVALHSVERFALDFWRADLPMLFVTWNHLYCVAALGLALGLMAWNLRRGAGVPSQV
ncbi:MAG: hypothetical protein H5T59_08505 [Anaerolineae bacterium]|nr:hypothetical protein [Anaerolineae bacterium]